MWFRLVGLILFVLRLVAAMRCEFGGHLEKSAPK